MLKPLPLWGALLVAVASGLCLTLSFPALGWWPLAFASVFLLGWSLLGRSWLTSLVVGIVAGASFWLTLIRWLTLYLGPVPWLALGILETLICALGASLIGLILNRGSRKWSSPWGYYVLIPLVSAALWTLREMVSSNAPYGGFSWGLLAQSQSQSPYTPIVAWLGTFGLSFTVAVLPLAALQVMRKKLLWKPAVMVIGLFVLLPLVPLPQATSVGTMSVLAVQGNSQAGLFDDRSSGDILADHIAGSLPYLGRHIDAIVWPENAADLNPLDVAYSAAALNKVSADFAAPIVTGTITHDTQGTYFNSSLVWEAGKGATAQFDKIHPVPFAEYMPDRPFWRALAPDLVDLVGYDYGLGTRPNVVKVNNVPVGLSICFDISYEQQARAFIAGGAQVVFAQTNNADFGRTDENLQQLAIARLRAVETGRAVVNISTVGTSAIIDSSGSALAQIPAYEPGAMLENVPLYKNVTPAMFFSEFYEVLLTVIALVGLLMLITWRRKP